MKPILYPTLLLLAVFAACDRNQERPGQNRTEFISLDGILEEGEEIVDPDGMTLETRFMVPEDYERTNEATGSFAEYLRELPLKPHNSEVLFYNGSVKTNFGVYEAVVDLKIGKKNLHQCADAVMRLRAEYLWNQKKYDQIHFNFTNGFRVDYSKWMKGNRIVVEGNKSYWKSSTSASNTYETFWKYMEIIFTYAGTLSLEKELNSVDLDDMKIGDVFIQGGSPGHAIIVVDMAEHLETGEKLFMLAQSYMPAQETQILKNRKDPSISPWYSLEFSGQLETPEWTFERSDLKRFSD